MCADTTSDASDSRRRSNSLSSLIRIDITSLYDLGHITSDSTSSPNPPDQHPLAPTGPKKGNGYPSKLLSWLHLRHRKPGLVSASTRRILPFKHPLQTRPAMSRVREEASAPPGGS